MPPQCRSEADRSNPVSRHQITIPETLPFQAGHRRHHLLDGVEWPEVVSSCKLVHVPLEMLSTHPVVGSVVPPLEH